MIALVIGIAATAFILYRLVILPIEIEDAIDQHDAAQPPKPGSSPDVVVSLLSATIDTQRELLSLVRALAINVAGAEKAAKLTAHLADPVRVADLPESEPSFFPEVDEPAVNYRQSHLAEALAHIETPDGGKLTDP